LGKRCAVPSSLARNGESACQSESASAAQANWRTGRSTESRVHQIKAKAMHAIEPACSIPSPITAPSAQTIIAACTALKAQGGSARSKRAAFYHPARSGAF